MSDRQSDNFDDPALKSAIRRVWGKETAPPLLAQRIRAAAQSGPRGWMLRPIPRSWLVGVAAAAVIVVGIGIYYSQRPAPSPNGGGIVTPANELQATLADQLVDRHEKCCAVSDHHMPGFSHDDFPLMGKQLTTVLGFPVLAVDLKGNWNFHGASICPVGPTQIRSGHLVFERGDRTFVSIFSLPKNYDSCRTAPFEMQQIDAKHPMAGFLTASAFYCIVGSSKDGSLTLDDVRSIRDQLRSDVALRAEPRPPALASSGEELLH